MRTISKQYKLNYFDIAENSNKVWIGSAYTDGTFETQYGRVREGSRLAVSSKKLGSEATALAELERKRAEKLRKGYRDTPVLDNETIISNAPAADLSKIAVEQISGADDSLTAELIKYLVEVNIHAIDILNSTNEFKILKLRLTQPPTLSL
jgi:predicted DNA-binding WGR domain protein